MAEKWTVWWQGSGPQRGAHIMRLTPSGLGYASEVAYLGDKSHELAHEIVSQHNEQPSQ